MCGRYVLYNINKLQDRYTTEEGLLLNNEPLYNVAPGFIMPVIIKEGKTKIEEMKWGFIPHWAKDPKIGYKMINARAESLKKLPAFKGSFKEKRCLIPINGFYEWKKNGSVKKPYYITTKDGDVLSLAGLYDSWKDAEGKEIKTYTIITSNPNSLLKPIHNRMPVIIKREQEDNWITNGTSENELLDMCEPYENSNLISYEVSTKVNNPKNQTDDLINKFESQN